MSYLGPLAAFGASVTWAIGSTGYARLSQTHSPYAVNFARATVALPMFVVVAFLQNGIEGGLAEYARVEASHWMWFSIAMAASFGLGDSLFFVSAGLLGVPGALAIASCYPIWTALADWIFQNQGLAGLQVLGLLLVVAGVCSVILSKGARHLREKGAGHRKGVLLAICVSLLWATNSFAVSRGGGALVSPVANTVRMGLALVMAAFFNRVMSPGTPTLLPLEAYRKWGWLFAFEGFGGALCFVYGLTHAPLAVAAALSSLAPVLSVPVAWALRLEKFSVYRTIGVFTVVLGIWFLVGKTA